MGFTFFQERLAALDVVLTAKAFFNEGFTSLRVTLGGIFGQFDEDLFQGTDGERSVFCNGGGGFIHELFDFWFGNNPVDELHVCNASSAE